MPSASSRASCVCVDIYTRTMQASGRHRKGHSFALPRARPGHMCACIRHCRAPLMMSFAIMISFGLQVARLSGAGILQRDADEGIRATPLRARHNGWEGAVPAGGQGAGAWCMIVQASFLLTCAFVLVLACGADLRVADAAAPGRSG